MNYNEWAKEIHENAVKHGWYDKPISDDEYETLFGSKLSEAFEEYFNGRSNVYYLCQGCFCCDDGEDGVECERKDVHPYNSDICLKKDPRPRGAAMELVELVIRLLDYAGAKGLDINAVGKEYYIIMPKTKGFENVIDLLYSVAKNVAYGAHDTFTVVNIRAAITIVEDYCKSKHLDFETLLRLKHEYNKTRLYRHGGKKC